MRIPFPERIPLLYSFAFALGLCALQLLEGTELVFSLGCFFFILVATAAFNVAGGFTRPSGSYVFFFATLALIVGLITKVLFGEAAQTHLRLPNLTISIYLAGITAMLASVYLSRRFSRRTGILQELVNLDNLRLAMIGCLVAGVLFAGLAAIVNSSHTETVFTPIFRAYNQLNRFLFMAVILGVTYEIQASGGRRSLNIYVLTAWAVMLFQGVFLGYSKEGLFSPLVCWLAACAASGFRFRPLQIIAGALFTIFCVQYLVPYCQYGRSFRNETNTFSQDFAIASNLIVDLPEVKRLYEQQEAAVDRSTSADYFDTPKGLFDRLEMISIDDGLNVATEQKGALGIGIIAAYFGNVVPHVIWKDKPVLPQANFYGHELGLLANEDDETSISVSPLGEAYRLAKWGGVLVLAPVLWFMLFVSMDSLCGDLRKSPWGLLALVAFAHFAPEGALGGVIYAMTYGIIGIVFVAFFAAYVLPIFASFVTPPKRPRFDASPAFTSARPATRIPKPLLPEANS